MIRKLNIVIIVALISGCSNLHLSNESKNYESLNYYYNVKEWNGVIKKTSHQELEINVLSKINHYINSKIKYENDLANWGFNDYWATPRETLFKLKGDCEDYVIIKYISLLKYGIDPKKLKFIYAKIINSNQAHMALAYYDKENSTPIILDNITNYIKPLTSRLDLNPIYSFNRFGMWLIKDNYLEVKITRSNKLHDWLDLEKRLEKKI